MDLAERIRIAKEASDRFRAKDLAVTMTGAEWEHIGHILETGAELVKEFSPKCFEMANIPKFAKQLTAHGDSVGLPPLSEMVEVQRIMDQLKEVESGPLN